MKMNTCKMKNEDMGNEIEDKDQKRRTKREKVEVEEVDGEEEERETEEAEVEDEKENVSNPRYYQRVLRCLPLQVGQNPANRASGTNHATTKKS